MYEGPKTFFLISSIYFLNTHNDHAYLSFDNRTEMYV
jgi:hypothetical protein